MVRVESDGHSADDRRNGRGQIDYEQGEADAA
jgi:hypothetical protein